MTDESEVVFDAVHATKSNMLRFRTQYGQRIERNDGWYIRYYDFGVAKKPQAPKPGNRPETAQRKQVSEFLCPLGTKKVERSKRLTWDTSQKY